LKWTGKRFLVAEYINTCDLKRTHDKYFLNEGMLDMKNVIMPILCCLLGANFAFAEAPVERIIDGNIIYAEREITIDLRACRDKLRIINKRNFEWIVDYPLIKQSYEEILSASISTLGYLPLELTEGYTDEIYFSFTSSGYRFSGSPHYTSPKARHSYTKDEAIGLIALYLEKMKADNRLDKKLSSDNKFKVTVRYLVPESK
jgi:hypothetical protein